MFCDGKVYANMATSCRTWNNLAAMGNQYLVSGLIASTDEQWSYACEIPYDGNHRHTHKYE
jgi:hypothetical protein